MCGRWFDCTITGRQRIQLNPNSNTKKADSWLIKTASVERIKGVLFTGCVISILPHAKMLGLGQISPIDKSPLLTRPLRSASWESFPNLQIAIVTVTADRGCIASEDRVYVVKLVSRGIVSVLTRSGVSIVPQ